jgi:hypothetical protein
LSCLRSKVVAVVGGEENYCKYDIYTIPMMQHYLRMRTIQVRLN